MKKKPNKYVPVIMNKHVAHLMEQGAPGHFLAPFSDLQTNGERCQQFRRQFKFKAHAYCFICGLPQDQNHNREGPECHKLIVLGGKEKCPFQHVVFKAGFVADQIEHLLKKMCEELRIPGRTFDMYVDWASSEKEEEGHYHSSIEVFLWCCEQLEQEQPW